MRLLTTLDPAERRVLDGIVENQLAIELMDQTGELASWKLKGLRTAREDRVMTRDLTGKIEGRSFTLAQLGHLKDIDRYIFEHPAIPGRHPGKLFLKDQLKLTGMEVSLNKAPPGSGMPFLHKHQRNEELYIFVKGKGLFEIDGQQFDVREGTVIRVAPDGVRSWTNNSSEDLYFFVIQAPAGGLPAGSISDGARVERSSAEAEKPSTHGETDP